MTRLRGLLGLLLLSACGEGEAGLADGGASEPVVDAAMDVAGEADADTGCEPGSRTGPAGSSDDVPTIVGAAIDVRTPEDYDPTVAHPLIVVYAPAGADAALTEQFTGLTPGALARGYIIAYVDHISPSTVDVIDIAATIPDEIVQTWCVDEERIFLTGHSDGGTISEVALARDDEAPAPRAAAPSAAGVTGASMTSLGCPAEARSMLVMHSSNDQLFPLDQGFGAAAARFWVDCNACEDPPGNLGGCHDWDTCDDGARVLYCEGTNAHGQWPGLNMMILDFFDALM